MNGIDSRARQRLSGEHVQPAWVQACQEALGDAFTVEPVDSDHVLILEQPGEVARHLNAFLKG